MAKNNAWTREQTIIALNLYCKIPFNKVGSNHPLIIEIAKLIGRTPNSVKMKIGNFGSFDEELQKRGIVGLANSSKLDEEIWHEFNNDWETLSYESELLIAKYKKQPLQDSFKIDFPSDLTITERLSLVKQRVKQDFFRSTILSSYNTTCCITGISTPILLNASHIVPWSKDVSNRLNPRNGLCLNVIHDKAFDKGLITVTPDFRVKLGDVILASRQQPHFEELFFGYENREIILPNRFKPSLKFLEFHNEHIFNK